MEVGPAVKIKSKKLALKLGNNRILDARKVSLNKVIRIVLIIDDKFKSPKYMEDKNGKRSAIKYNFQSSSV